MSIKNLPKGEFREYWRRRIVYHRKRHADRRKILHKLDGELNTMCLMKTLTKKTSHGMASITRRPLFIQKLIKEELK